MYINLINKGVLFYIFWKNDNKSKIIKYSLECNLTSFIFIIVSKFCLPSNPETRCYQEL